MSDGESYREFPKNFAIEQWRQRRENWGKPVIKESLEESIDPDLKAMRDHEDFSVQGIEDFLTNARSYAAKEEDWTNEGFAKIVEIIEQSQQETDERYSEKDLFEALHGADYLLFPAIYHREEKALEDPIIAINYIDESLLVNPSHGEGINYEELLSFYNFNETTRTEDEKLTLSAKLIHQLSGSMKARGLYNWFGRPIESLNGMTPRQIIEYGSVNEINQLLNWAKSDSSPNGS
jgi:hypothetical protein